MAQSDRLKQYLDTGIAFTELSRQRAEKIVRDLVKSGDIRREEAKKRVDELLDRSKQTTEGLRALVEYEVKQQVSKLGLVPKSELDEVRAELAQLRTQQPKTVVASAPQTPTVKKPPAKKAVAKKAPAAKKATP